MEELNKNSISKNENDTILSWIKYLETIRGYGEHTLDAYKRDVLEFSNFCNDKNYEFLSPDKYVLENFCQFYLKDNYLDQHWLEKYQV